MYMYVKYDVLAIAHLAILFQNIEEVYYLCGIWQNLFGMLERNALQLRSLF